MIDLKPIYTTTSAEFLLALGIVLLAAGVILIATIVCAIIIETRKSYHKSKHATWLQRMSQWVIDDWGALGLIFAAWLIVLCIGVGLICVIPNSDLRQAAATPKAPSTQTIVRYVESKTDVTHLSCDDKTDTDDIIPCTFMLNNAPRDGKLVIDNDHATLFYNDNATFVPVTVKPTN